MSDTNTIILCPGQGAQAIGMGKAWHDASEHAKAVYTEANDVLGFDLAKLCFEGPAEDLNRTDNAQVAIYVASVACFRGLQAKGDLQRFTATAGLSLGEFTALHLVGAFSFADGLKLVRLRGEAMQAAAEASPSSMVAITGEVNETNIEVLCDQVNDALPKEAIMVPANYNSPMQVVVSGTLDACELMVTHAAAEGLRATPLSVAGAFHSPIMQPAALQLQQALADVAWSKPAVQVLSNVTGEPHAQDPSLIQKRLVEQLTNPVRWTQSMQYAATNLPGRYVELAPGKVLSGLMRRTEKSIRVENFDSPKD